MRFRQYLIERNVLNISNIEESIKYILKHSNSLQGIDPKLYKIIEKWASTHFKKYVINDYNKNILKLTKIEDLNNHTDKEIHIAKKIIERGEQIYKVMIFNDIELHNKLEHMFDFIKNMDNPEKILKMGFQDVERAADLWTKSLAKRKGDLSGIELISKLSDGFTLVKLLTKSACEHEGNIMQHCSASYSEKVESRQTSIYSIRDRSNESHVSIEIQNNTVIQIKGKQNQFPIEKYHKYILEVFTKVLKNVGVDLSEYGLVKDVKGNLYSVENMPDGIQIKGDLDLRKVNIKSLLGIECDEIYARGSKLESISKDLKCRVLNIQETNVKYLPGIECDEIYAYGSKLGSISKDLKCKTLDISKTNVKYLPGIECDKIYVGESKLESISKDLKYKVLDIRNTPLSKRIGKDTLSQEDIKEYGV